MKTIMLWALAALLSPGAWAAEPSTAPGVKRVPDARVTVLREKPNPGAVAVSVGERFKIELPWDPEKEPNDEWAVAMVDAEMVAIDPTTRLMSKENGRKVGLDVFRIRGLKPGRTTLVLEYRRHDEKVPATRTFKVEITINAAADAAQEPLSFVLDASLRNPDGSAVNPNAEDFMRRHASAGGTVVRLVAGDEGSESTCARKDGAWTCRIGRQSAMSDGLYRFILARAAPASAAPEEKAEQAPLRSDSAGLFAGYRGVTLSLPGHQVAFLKKGDHVDVMVTFEAKMADKRKEKVTATILQNVRIVEVLKPAQSQGRGTVQILLNPNEAQYAALSDAQGDLHVALRAPGDVEMHPMEMASFRKLFR
ncbi:MAG: RcpC/CpaB family pilus assembly protein [Elusimicrobia bacterium]|nr:RcpC/CpaB family pilus assembly protein [Elusimicrobiota bacterium]